MAPIVLTVFQSHIAWPFGWCMHSHRSIVQSHMICANISEQQLVDSCNATSAMDVDFSPILCPRHVVFILNCSRAPKLLAVTASSVAYDQVAV